MEKRNLNVIRAKDMLIFLAKNLPENLLLDAVNDYGNFAADFLIRLSDEQLSLLKAEAKKYKDENVFLSFSTKLQGTTLGPMEMKNYSNFDWDKVSEITISGDTQAYLEGTASDPQPYINVVFVLKS